MKNTKTKYPSEHLEQVRFVAWMRKTHPNHWVFAIPNGGDRHRVTAAKLKAEGVSPGVPDLYIPSLKLWVEMKRQKGGSLSAHQKEWRDYLLSIGDNWVLGNGFDDAVKKVSDIILQFDNH
ncbi:putative VRR-nuclease [Idiomarinaceae phage 1N2-2]|uniref:putative VRR-nuclease n=1 Tax=Idiomarinaceae phage 1N2-2 TaxID=1536592 RepID=UPI0004F87B39|nr:putative VRR-nuclease [Idiomarinaceae phage 1N2-2]AIM40747.1 putative VRR-nuclease [Idiomarinaceae phage 1N2-2]